MGAQNAERYHSMRLIIGATVATLLLGQAALAWNPPSEEDQTATEPEQNTTQAQQASIERVLTAAGFTDIQMITTSFLVRAKNSAGKPVIMIVDPTSMTASVIDIPQSTSDEDSTTGRR
jgi:hypothetical protein